jgi:three-Cys-motif partner protein
VSEITSTVWPIEAHTKAKHEILRNYLNAWFPILSKWSGRIIYLDGFAGPGVYAAGEVGSPVIAVQTALEHTQRERFKEIIFFFIEKDPERAKMLLQVLRQRFPNLPPNMKYEIQGAAFEPTFERVLDDVEKKEAKLAPTFAFLDPFGFTGFPMKLIGRVMGYDRCEVMITFMASFVRRFLDELREPALTDLFGTDEWKKAREIENSDERLRFLLDLYENQLRRVGRATHVRSFGMIGSHNQIIYYLVYGTKHWKGLDVMKEAMWKVDRRGTYTFSDLTDVGQAYLIDYNTDPHWIPSAAKMIHEHFRGRTVKENKVHEFVAVGTPFIYRKTILKYMETCSPPLILNVSPRTRSLSYPEGCNITFSE